MKKNLTKSLMRILTATFFCLLIPWCAFAQKTITGVVLDQKKMPLPGASVVEKGTQNGTMTNSEGKFTLTIKNPDAIIVAKIIGYISKERTVGSNTTFNFELDEDNQTLSEVVLIGYQKITRRKSTASISSISGKELANLPSASFDQLLQGRLAGVNVQNFTGQPGATPTVSVRGNSTASREYNQYNAVRSPLYVVDGIPQSTDANSAPNTGTGTNYLAGINPLDIESIDVLKDASAAAIYGSRAANGVILITTKKGVSGEPKVNVSLYTGFVQRPELRQATAGAAERNQKLEVLRRQLDYGQLRQLPYILTDSLNPAFNANTDWQNLFYQVGKLNNADFSLSGGADAGMLYRFSGGYYNEQGIIKSTGIKRYSTRLNLQSKALKQKLLINPQFFYTRTDRARGGENPDDPSNPTRLGGANLPSSLINLSPEKLAYFTSPTSENLDKNIGNQFGINLNLSLEITKKLILNSQSSFQLDNSRRDRSVGNLQNNGFGNSSSSFADVSTNLRTSNFLTYSDKIGKHSFSAFAAQDIEYSQYQQTFASGSGGASDNIQVVSGFQQANISAFSLYRANGLIGYLGRLSYDYAEKYLISGSLRTDGSSGFGKNNKWGLFPAISAGWILSEENFMKNLAKTFTLIKIRGSYGVTGAEDRRNAYLQYNTYSVNNGSFSGNAGSTSYNGVTAITPDFRSGVAQNNLSWERAASWNLGADFEIQNGKYSFTVDAYNRETSNKLFPVDLPITTGYDFANTNAFAVRNSGVEFSLNANPVRKAIKWSTTFNIAYNKNQIMSLPNNGRDIILSGDRFDKTHVLSVGSPINAFYLYRTKGIFKTDADIPRNPFTGERYRNSNGTFQAGDFYLADLDGDYFVDIFNDGINPDKAPIGDPNPKFVGGWFNNLTYKNFSLGISGTFTFGRDVLNLFDADRFSNSTDGDAINRFASFSTPDLDKIDIWRNPGDNAEYAKYDLGQYRYYYTGAQTFFLEKGGYFRLQNITLGYDLGAKTLKKLGMGQLKIYSVIQNVFILQQSKKLPDAEGVNQYGEYVGTGYPIPKKYTLGVQLQF